MSDIRDHLTQLARAWPPAGAAARLRARPDDFIVDERLSFQPDGAGEHAFLSIRKTGLNTEQVARLLARHAGVRARDVGYAGLKDRHAVTTQAFTVYLPGREVDWQAVAGAQLEICLATRHGRKLRRGALAGNRFRLTLRDVAGDVGAIEARLQMLREHGAPNYFMEQRFGRDAGNLVQARQILEEGKRVRDRHLRGLFYSAARAYLFNQVLSRRCTDGSWERGMPGDCMMLDHSRAVFSCDAVDDEIANRVRQGEIHPTGPLWGRGEPLVQGQAAVLERGVLESCQSWMTGLEREGIDMARRRLRMRIADLQWEWLDQTTLELTFSLGPGSYATAVIRELCELLPEDGSAA